MSWSYQNVLTHCSYWSDDSNVAGASDVGIDDAIDDMIDVVALLMLFAAAIDVAFFKEMCKTRKKRTLNAHMLASLH